LVWIWTTLFLNGMAPPLNIWRVGSCHCRALICSLLLCYGGAKIGNVRQYWSYLYYSCVRYIGNRSWQVDNKHDATRTTHTFCLHNCGNHIQRQARFNTVSTHHRTPIKDQWTSCVQWDTGHHSSWIITTPKASGWVLIWVGSVWKRFAFHIKVT